MAIKKPSDWLNSTLGDVAEDILSGGTPSTKDDAFWEGTIPWITSKWLNDSLYLCSGEKYISRDAIKKSASRIIPSGNLIFATRVGVGKVAVNKIDLAINQDLAGILVDERKILPEFLTYQLRIDRIQQFVEQNKRGATIKGITKSCLREISLLIPPPAEQRRIAAVLSLVQRVIEQQERLIALTTELKKALMHKLFTEGTRREPQKQTEIGLIPSSWEVLEFQQFAVMQRGKDLTRANFRGGSVPVAGSNGIIGFHDEATVSGPGVTVGRSGSVGKVTFYKKDFWAHNTALYVKDFKGNHEHFTAYYFELLDLSRFKTGASVPTLDRNTFRKMSIAIPDRSEQMEIAETLVTIDQRIAGIEKKKETISDLFRTLLHQLVTAEIRVNHLDLEELGLEVAEE